jgi:hypothetical protein
LAELPRDHDLVVTHGNVPIGGGLEGEQSHMPIARERPARRPRRHRDPLRITSVVPTD